MRCTYPTCTNDPYLNLDRCTYHKRCVEDGCDAVAGRYAAWCEIHEEARHDQRVESAKVAERLRHRDEDQKLNDRWHLGDDGLWVGSDRR